MEFSVHTAAVTILPIKIQMLFHPNNLNVILTSGALQLSSGSFHKHFLSDLYLFSTCSSVLSLPDLLQYDFSPQLS